MRPLKNFKLVIEYDGTGFNGWQVQSQGERTIQGEIQKVLLQVFKQKLTVIASGRTDTGVHAVGQVINFKVRTRMLPVDVRKALTAFLPSDIVILQVEDVDLSFHSQYSAKRKTYRYTILNRAYASAKERNFCHFYPYKLNLGRMRREARALLGRRDFKSFEASDHERAKHSTIRTLTKIDIRKKGDWVTIDIEANGFLYRMVRNIVGTLLEIGSGTGTSRDIKAILKQKNRSAAGQTVASCGLCLLKVDY